jgi:molybdopterin converting factor small subunit
MRVLLPSPLLHYTNERREVSASGGTLDELLRDLDRQFPGIRFRMIDEQDGLREHMRIFINGRQVRDIRIRLGERDEVQIIQALSGG